MRYYLDSSTLFIHGSFRAASTGSSGGIRSVSAILCHTSEDAKGPDREKILGIAAARAGIGGDWFGILTTIPVSHACVLQYDFITVFIVAGIHRGPSGDPGITIVVCSNEGMSDSALLETIMVATEAKAEALMALDLPLSGTPADAVIVASEGEEGHYTGSRGSEAGKRIREAVLHGIPQALARHDTGVVSENPAFFIYSRLKEEHWIAWSPKNCPYYPCHFREQSCDFCYCPFYPCREEDLGQWVDSAGKGKIWNCSHCNLLHKPEVTAYLHQFPGASLKELKNLRIKQ